MSFFNTLEDIATGAGVAIAVVTALPFAGAAGTITATGAVVAGSVGAAAKVIDKINEN